MQAEARGAHVRSRVAAFALLVIASASTSGIAAQSPPPVRFAVIGHLRADEDGRLNAVMPELVARLREIQPDLIFLTGDMIAGNQGDSLADAGIIRADWDRLDSALAATGIPVHRVPGNHDLHDPITRDIYFERYGRLPSAFDERGVRFVLLNTAFMPAGDAPMPPNRSAIAVRDSLDDPAQLEFLRMAMVRSPAPRHVFVFTHHQLWWKEDAAWWRTVHPAITKGPVRAVFSGDRSPIGTFSHETRDGVEYIQSNVEYAPTIGNLVDRRRNARRYAQFSTFMVVTVRGDAIDYDVRTVGALASNEFTPETWRAVRAAESPARLAPVSATGRLLQLAGGRRRLAGMVLIAGVCFAAGAAVAVWARSPDRDGDAAEKT